MSIGEIEKGKSYFKKIKRSWIIGKNRDWNSLVMNIADRKYREFLFKEVIEPMRERGFKNFFFDTLDSYQSISGNREFLSKMESGLISFIKEFKSRYSDSKIVINRGFEIVDRVHDKIEALLFESLFYGLSMSAKGSGFKAVSPEDRSWLLGQLEKVKNFDIPIISVEYIPEDEVERIEESIAQIDRLKIIPYIAFNRELDSYGISNRRAMKREIVLIYDDTQFDGTDRDDKIYSTAFSQLSLPLEYMGYVPILKPISSFKATKKSLQRFAGAVIWINGSYAVEHPKKFMKLVSSIYLNGTKVLILESLNEKLHKTLFEASWD